MQNAFELCYHADMRHDEFTLGMKFRCSGTLSLWQVTDIGSRTIVAIELNEADPSWNAGPPYALQELVFDELDIIPCEPASR